MSGKRHKPEEIVAKLPQVDVLVSQGKPVAEAVRSTRRREAGDLAAVLKRTDFGGFPTFPISKTLLILAGISSPCFSC